jgi:hypothetical protein
VTPYAHAQDTTLHPRALDILATGVLQMLRIAEHGATTEHQLAGSPEQADSFLASLELPPLPAISLPGGEWVDRVDGMASSQDEGVARLSIIIRYRTRVHRCAPYPAWQSRSSCGVCGSCGSPLSAIRHACPASLPHGTARLHAPPCRMIPHSRFAFASTIASTHPRATSGRLAHASTTRARAGSVEGRWLNAEYADNADAGLGSAAGRASTALGAEFT